MTGLSDTSASTGSITPAFFNRTAETIVIRLVATSAVDPTKTASVDFTVLPEAARSLSVSADTQSVDSGKAFVLNYALDCSPSLMATISWTAVGETDAVTIYNLPETTEANGSVNVIVVNNGMSVAGITFTATYGNHSESITMDVSPVEIDAISSATLSNIAALRSQDPVESGQNVFVTYAISDDASSDYKWTFVQCDPDNHADEYPLSDDLSLQISFDGASYQPVRANDIFETSAARGHFWLKADNSTSAPVMIVVQGYQMADDPDSADPDVPDRIRVAQTGFHLTISTERIAVSGLSLGRDVLNLKVGDAEALTATVAPSNATNKSLTWQSSAPGVASVDANGKVTAVAVGSAIITVESVENNSISASCAVTVTDSSGQGGNGSAGGSTSETIPDPEIPQTDPETLTLTDIGNHWAKVYIRSAVEKGIVNGRPDGTFRPDNAITRAEFVKMVVVAFHLTAADSESFSDVKNHWAKSYIGTAASLGVILGTGENKFSPDRPITRQDMAVIIGRVCELQDLTLRENREAIVFSDEARISGYAKDSVERLGRAEILSGSGGLFRPLDSATRAESVKIIMITHEAVS